MVRLCVADISPDAAGIRLTRGISAVAPPLRPVLRALRSLAAPRGPLTPVLSTLGSGKRPNFLTLRRLYNTHHVPDALRVDGTRQDPGRAPYDVRRTLERLHPDQNFAAVTDTNASSTDTSASHTR